MNPLDDEELIHFQNIIKEMPYHDDNIGIIPFKHYEKLPNNIMNYSAKIDNNFLNDNLAIIEEINHRDSKHWIPLWFREYQNKIYKTSGILNHDGFFNELGDMKGTHYLFEQPFMMSWPSINRSSSNPGDTLETVASENDSFNATSLLVTAKVSSTVVDTTYDQIAISQNSGGANWHVGVWDDNSAPNNLLVDSGSIAVASGYTLNTITEFTITTTTSWIGFGNDGTLVNFDILTGQTNGNMRYSAFSYGALTDPAPAGTLTTQVGRFKIAHT